MAQALAATQSSGVSARRLSGVERAAVVLFALGEAHGAPVWQQLDELELRDLSQAMSTLGKIDAQTVEELLVEFVSRLSATGSLVGNVDSTERLLAQFLPKDRVGQIMEEIRGPAGRTMWEKLSNVQDSVLANYLKNEYPQTVAVVLSQIRPEQAARVLAILPEDSRSTSCAGCWRWSRSRRTFWSGSRRPFAPSSCPASARRRGATATSRWRRSSTPSTARPRRAS